MVSETISWPKYRKSNKLFVVCRYSCSRCNSLQDAVREIKIEQMPEVGNYPSRPLSSKIGLLYSALPFLILLGAEHSADAVHL